MSAVQPEVLDKIHTKIQQLESAITRISRTKQQLKENALLAKDGIHSTISRHLEALRNREVWLLGQVDLLEHAKEDIMRQQQAELNQAVGGLKNALELMDDPNLVQQMQDVLHRVEALKLSPDETPYLTFRSDPLALRDSIHEFGQVDTRSLPIQRAFVPHESSSTCLPRSFEEYEDADHHMLYKTVQGLHNAAVKVTIPKLSKDEWLSKPRLPVRPASIPSYLDRMATDASIKNWLCQIKHEGDMEEDNYMESSPGVTSSSGSEGVSSPECPFKHLTAISNSPMSKWLKQRVPASCPYDKLQAFQHVPGDYAQWLASGKFTPTETKVTTECHKDDTSDWLKPRDVKNGAPLTPPRFTAPTDTATWLLSKQPTTACAQWLISSSPNAVSTPESSQAKPTHLFKFFDNISSNPSVWLKKPGMSNENAVPITDLFGHISNDMSTWLKKRTTLSDDGLNEMNDDDDDCSIEMVDMPVQGDSKWIKSTSGPTNNHESERFGFETVFQELDNQQWLKQSTSKCPFIDSNLQNFVYVNEGGELHSEPSSPVEDSDVDKWLHPSRRRGQMSCDPSCDMES